MANVIDAEALQILRKKIFLTGYKGGMMHLASCYSCLEIIYTLYEKGILQYDIHNPSWKDRDRFILGKGHAGLALYGILNHLGILSDQDYASYLTLHGKIGGEPCMRDNVWVEATTGSLGHGLPIAVGMALGLKLDKSPAKVYIVLGDGECEEGSIWEAAMAASMYKLDNLVAILDNNRIQKMDFVDNIIGKANWKDRWQAFGWNVDEIDGHSVDALTEVLKRESVQGKPRFIIAKTVKGKGISIMENNPNWHFKLPNRKELKVFKRELGVTDAELE